MDITSAMVRMAFLVVDLHAAAARRHEMPAQQAQLLCVVGDCLPTMGEAGALMRIEKSSITGLVQRAEAAGLVEKEPDQADGRSQRLKLTVAGTEHAEAFKASVIHDLSQILETLSPEEQDSVAHILSQVIAAHGARQWVTAVFDASSERIPLRSSGR